mgnify:CR=1 FL=1|jgi:hypothetical protein
MVQILRVNIVTTAGTIVRDYTEVADELGVYVVEDIEAERQYIADCYTSQGYIVERVNLMYVTK